MARERKRNHPPPADVIASPRNSSFGAPPGDGPPRFQMGSSDAVSGGRLSTPRAAAAFSRTDGCGAGPEPPRWSPPVDRWARPEPPRRRRSYLAIGLLAVALLAVAVARGLVLQALLPIMLAVAAVALLLRGSAGRTAR